MPREVWSSLTACRGDGKNVDSPLTHNQYINYKGLISELNSKSSDPIIDIEDIPEWVNKCLEAADKRDEIHSRYMSASSTPLSQYSQSDVDVKYFSDLQSRGDPRADQLLPYQVEGVQFGLRRNGRLLIADEMGLGKTLQALVIAYQYSLSDWPLLIICPSSIRFVWREQIARWLAGLIDTSSQVQVVTKGKETIRGSARIVVVPYSLIEPNPHLLSRPGDGRPYDSVICDESHYIKDPTSKRSKAVSGVLAKARRVILLSGTPSLNNAQELFPQIAHLLPVKPSLNQFRQRYCIQSSLVIRGFPVVKWAGGRCKDELNYLLNRTVMIRRMKNQVLKQLPEKRRCRVTLDGSKSILAGKIQQMTADWVSGGGRDHGLQAMELWRLTGQAKLDAVREYLSDLLEGSEGKVILFAHHKFVMDGLETLVAKKGGYMRIDGSVAQDNRASLVYQFQNDPNCRVALLSITGCAEGLTLTAASTIVFAETYWVPGTLEQAEARAHRVGQTNCVMVYYLVLPDSPEEFVLASLERKKRDTSVILDGKEQGMRVGNDTVYPGTQQSVQPIMGTEIDGIGIDDLIIELETDGVEFTPNKKIRTLMGDS
jgi:SWI/SNF-related matrix-associated actin-dependent regulator 1 of chromatin subfamily A